jgi:hypothetical protein
MRCVARSIDDVVTVWGTVKDLVAEDQPSYVRKLGYEIMHALIEGQHDRLGSLRMGTAISNLSIPFSTTHQTAWHTDMRSCAAPAQNSSPSFRGTSTTLSLD